KLDWQIQQVSGAFAQMSLTMPDLSLGADSARASFRAMVESLDMNTVHGQELFAALMGLADPLAQVITGFEELNGVAAETAQAARSAADIAKERYNLETQLLQLMGDTDALRARELVAIDESNHALQQHIWAMNDQAAAAQAASAAF